MERTYSSNEEARNVAKEAMWLAYQAARPMGLGFLHENGGESREKVIEATFQRPDDGYADYVFGRMMKTGFRIKDAVLSCNDEARGDYQSWAGKYGGYSSLVNAAEKSLAVQPVAA